MDIFKIRLNKALSSNRIGKLEEFLLKEGKRKKDKIRKYADYILKNCSDSKSKDNITFHKKQR